MGVTSSSLLKHVEIICTGGMSRPHLSLFTSYWSYVHAFGGCVPALLRVSRWHVSYRRQTPNVLLAERASNQPIHAPIEAWFTVISRGIAIYRTPTMCPASFLGDNNHVPVSTAPTVQCPRKRGVLVGGDLSAGSVCSQAGAQAGGRGPPGLPLGGGGGSCSSHP